MEMLSYKNNEQIGFQESSGESLVIYISINSCLYWYVEDTSHVLSQFNYLPLLTSGSLKLSFCTLMWELHFHLDNDTTGKTTASYYWNLSVWVRHLRATVLLSRLIIPLICMLNCSFAMFCTVRKSNVSKWDVWFWCCCCKIMLLLFFLQQVLPLNAIQWILLHSCQTTAEAVKLCWVVKRSFKS